MITLDELRSFHTYELPHQVTTCEVDPQNRLRPSHFLRLMQTSADFDSAQLGVSQKDLDARGQIVVITRTSVQIHRYPEALENLRIVTLHREDKGVRLYRDFLFFSGDHVLAESTNEYCVLDRKTRRVQKPTIYTENPAFARQNYVPGNPQPSRIVTTPDSIDRGYRKVLYSHLDINGHMNNANYCDFAVDALPVSLIRCAPDFFELNFFHEALYQNPVHLFYSFHDHDVIIDGQLEKTACFAMKMHFNELPHPEYESAIRREETNYA